MGTPPGYLQATRHPWPCLLFLIPLLAAYEAGIIWLGGTQAQVLRNGADAWLRWGLEIFGIAEPLAAPIFVLALMVIWILRRWDDRPQHTLSICFGKSGSTLSP